MAEEDNELVGGIRLEPHKYTKNPEECSHENWEYLMDYTEYAPTLPPHSIFWCPDCGATELIFKDEPSYPKNQTTR